MTTFFLYIETHLNSIHQFTDMSAVANLFDSIDISFQVGTCKHVVQMKIFINIEDYWIGATLRTRPERLTSRCLLVAWEIEQELLDLVRKVFFEMKSSPLDTVGKN